MCTVSMIGDYYQDKWKDIVYPNWPPTAQPQPFPYPYPTPVTVGSYIPPPSREEFEALKKEVLEMKELLKRAVKYDEDNNQPHCEQDEKIAILKKVAEMVGITLEDVFKK